MVSDKEFQKSKEIAAKTWQRLEDENLAPTPESYSLLYQYYTNTDIKIKKDIDTHTKKYGALTERSCSELYLQHIDNTKSQEILEKAEATMATIMNDVINIVSGVESATGSYDKALIKSSQKLGKVSSVDDLKKVVTAMVSDTRQMIVKNKNLEQELNLSSERMDDLRKEVAIVRKEAKTDGLTNLINRKAFDQALTKKMKETSKENKAVSLLMLDIDHFKKFNDTHGHQVGDQVLRLVAHTFVDGIKGKDVAARYGGEEFAIILPETNLTAAVIVGNALRKAIANKELINKNTGGTLGRITISIGAAESVKNESPVKLIGRADKALYAAKNKGRDQVCAAPKPSDF